MLARLLTLLWLLIAAAAFPALAGEPSQIKEIALSDLPTEAHQTLRLIRSGGPFPYKRDGIVFQNRERRLPFYPKGHYREYTVATPGLNHRGAKRIVAGRSGELYYTADHYQSFKRIRQ